MVDGSVESKKLLDSVKKRRFVNEEMVSGMAPLNWLWSKVIFRSAVMAEIVEGTVPLSEL